MGEKAVLAHKATWKFTQEHGVVQSFAGSFPLSERSAMKGTLKYLRNANYLPPDYQPEIYSDAYVIRVERKKNHSIDKFHHWVERHDLIKDLDQKLMHRREDPQAPHDQPQPLAAPAYPPLESEQAKRLIEGLNWQSADTGYPGSPSFLVAAVPDAQTASHAGYYLHKKGYITDAEYHRLNEEITHDLEVKNKGTEYRIAVPEQHFQRFEKKFPRAVTHDAPDDSWATTTKLPPRGPQNRAG